MDKQAELEKLEQRAFSARIPMYKLCGLARVAPSTITRWRANPDQMTAKTLKKLEDALEKVNG